MSKPTRQDIDRDDDGYVGALNSNFSSLIDAPFPMVEAVSLVALEADFAAPLYLDTLAIVDTMVYKSNGVSWELLAEQLSYVAPLDTGTATVTEIQTAYNDLLTDLQTKGWMS